MPENAQNWDDHTSNTNNPHNTTIAQIPNLQTELNNRSLTSHGHSNATPVAHGFMSSGDKSKLDGVANNANNFVHPVGDGNLHMPATGTGNNGRFLRAGVTAGSASWVSISASDVGAGAFHIDRIPALPISRITDLQNQLNNRPLTTGNIATATALQTSRDITLTGGATGTAAFNGTANANIAVTVPPTGHIHGFDQLRGFARSLAANTNLNTVFEGGFYRVNNATNLPTGVTSWVYLQIFQQSAQECVQIVRPFASPWNVWMRRSTNVGAWDAWSRPTADWNGLINRPTTFAPSAHTHAAGDITGTLHVDRIPNLGFDRIRGIARSLTAGTNLNTVFEGGFYRVSGATNLPPGVSGWVWLQVIQHNVQGSMQIVHPFTTPQAMWLRSSDGSGVWSAWARPVGDWNTLANRPTTFAPSAHNHTIANITNLQSELDNRITRSTLIPVNANLNDAAWRAEGRYHVATNANAATITNRPFNHAFSMSTYRHAANHSQGCHQVARRFDTNQISVRSMNGTNASWTPWRDLMFADVFEEHAAGFRTDAVDGHGEFVLGDLLILTGTLDISAVANVTSTVTLTFGRTFGTVPVVQVSASSAQVGVTLQGVATNTNPTRNNFQVHVRRSNTETTRVRWMAVGRR